MKIMKIKFFKDLFLIKLLIIFWLISFYDWLISFLLFTVLINNFTKKFCYQINLKSSEKIAHKNFIILPTSFLRSSSSFYLQNHLCFIINNHTFPLFIYSLLWFLSLNYSLYILVESNHVGKMFTVFMLLLLRCSAEHH
jgi:hypothetical protein